MVVGDDDVQAQAIPVAHLLDGADAAVNGHYQLGPLGGQIPQGTEVQAIALLDAMGDVGLDLGAQGGQRLHQERGSGHPVGVEVSVDDYRLSGADSPPDAGHGLIHPFHLEGVILPELASEEGLDLSGFGDAPVVEQLDEEGR